MRVVHLSDHVRDERERHAAARRGEQAAVEQLRELRRRRRSALFGLRLADVLRLSGEIAAAKRRLPAPSAPSPDEEILAAGQRGEDRVADQLAREFRGDDWVLYRGYKNARGEIDGVLVGPLGVVAIEIKATVGVISVDRDRWHRQKFDNYGNPREHGPLADGTGRSPSVQLNQAADALAAFLRSQRVSVPVRRVIVLAHPKSRIGTLHALTVDAVGTSASVVIGVLRKHGAALSLAERARIEGLVERDHAHFERRRARR